MSLTRKFAKLSSGDMDIAGGKGASLGEMTQAGIPVPPGFVILTDAFKQFIEANDLEAEIDAALHKVRHEETHTVEEASERIQGHILNAPISDDIQDAINKAFNTLDTELVAVRSSATAEDASEEAWAGQLESFLNVEKENLLQRVRECWASLFTPRAIFYRFENNLHDEDIFVAVVVQKMVKSHAAGVAFSVHPVTEDENQMIIEAGFGLGDAVVGGEITPDSYVIEKDDWTIVDINVNTQKKEYVKNSEGGSHWQNLPEEEGEKQVLSESQITELAKIVANVEDHYGFPVDVEWAMENGEFFVVQSRPITTLAQAGDEMDEYEKTDQDENLFGYWDEYNPRVVYPLEYDLYMEKIWQASLDMLDFGEGVPRIEDVVVFDKNVPVQVDPSKYEETFNAEKHSVDLQKEVKKWRKKSKTSIVK